MSAHSCNTCYGMRSSIQETEGEIKHLARIAAKRAGTQQAVNSIARIRDLKVRLRDQRRIHAQHLEAPDASLSMRSV